MRDKLAMDIIRGGIREFVYDADGPAFLKRELMGTGRSEFMIAHVEWCPINAFQEHLSYLSNVKSISLHTLELVL